MMSGKMSHKLRTCLNHDFTWFLFYYFQASIQEIFIICKNIACQNRWGVQFYMFKISLFFILFKCRFINSIWSRLLDPLVVVKICLRRYLSLKRPFVCFFAQIEWGLLCFSFVWFALDLRNYGHLSSSLPEFLLLLNASHIFTQGWCFFFILTFIFPLNLENITAFF